MPPPTPTFAAAPPVAAPRKRLRFASPSTPSSLSFPSTPCTPLPPRALLDPSVAVVLSHFEAAALLPLRKSAAALPPTSPPTPITGEWSINLGRDTARTLSLTPTGLAFPPHAHSTHVTFAELSKMCKKRRACAHEVFHDGLTAPSRIAGISALTSRAASLQPHVPRAPPTVALGGFCMHRFKGTDPGADTAAKVGALRRAGGARGRALDVCTGLGYTAIALARAPGVRAVTTVELDPLVADVARRNPWSEPLFGEGIERVVGDATEVLPRLGGGTFDAVVHDPPAQAMGGELYAEAFYRELARVLRPGGVLFHYVGDPKSVESGRLFKGVVQRLRAAGFEDVRQAPDAYGLTGVVR